MSCRPTVGTAIAAHGVQGAPDGGGCLDPERGELNRDRDLSSATARIGDVLAIGVAGGIDERTYTAGYQRRIADLHHGDGMPRAANCLGFTEVRVHDKAFFKNEALHHDGSGRGFPGRLRQ